MNTAAIITHALGGRWHGKYGAARCPAHNDSTPSLSIRDGDHGPILKCFGGCDSRAVKAELQERGLLSQTPRLTKAWPTKRSIDGNDAASGDEQRQHDRAAWLWTKRQSIEGTPAERYLRQVRGYDGRMPATLGFLPSRKREHHPALIAAYGLADEPEPGVLAPPYTVEAVHLTLLRPNGSGKAETAPNKITVGSPRGRPVIIAPPNDMLGLAITEGIEDALSVHEATGLGAWAAGSAGFMPKLADLVPSYIEVVTIFAHNDNAGMRGAKQLADVLATRNIEVRVEGLAR